MSITYAITINDELNSVKRLMHTLSECKEKDSEIIAVHCYSQTEDMANPTHIEIKDYLLNNTDTYCDYKFDNNVADLKNYIISLSTKDYIFLLDADEYLTTQTLALWNNVIKNEPQYDVFWTPRVNIVEDLTKNDIEKLGLKVNEKNWINWPDNQPRIFKNNGKVKWTMKEKSYRLLGVEKSGSLTADPRLATINRKKNVNV
jgi:hypothetical protein